MKPSLGFLRSNRNLFHSIPFLGFVLAMCASSFAAGAVKPKPLPLIPGTVVKLILDHPALAGYLHPEDTARIPLILSDHLLAPKIKLSKFSKPVVIVKDTAVGSRPHIRFMGFQAAEGGLMKAILEYKAEGVHGIFTLKHKAKGPWKIIEATVLEN
jgi:hypothetical protein